MNEKLWKGLEALERIRTPKKDENPRKNENPRKRMRSLGKD
jgi:hypothetical protein